ncbi:MAG: hypothetical protein Q9162_005706 [Coniocarpon cinnabarinum]
MSLFRLYIGSIPYAAQPQDIYDLFALAGIPVTNLDMSIDPFTGRNPGYVFVNVPDQRSYDTAMQCLPGNAVRGRLIKVNAACERKTIRHAGEEARVRSYDRPVGRNVRGILAGESDSGPSAFHGGSFAFNRWARGQGESPGRWENPAQENRRLYVGSLPRLEPQSAAQDIIGNTIFSKFNVEAISKMISPHKSTWDKGGNHYYAFVDLPSEEAAQAAVRTLDGMRTTWGFVRVKVASGRAAPKVVREQMLHRPAEV